MSASIRSSDDHCLTGDDDLQRRHGDLRRVADLGAVKLRRAADHRRARRSVDRHAIQFSAG